MNNNRNTNSSFGKVFSNLFNKLMQSPNVYPIKHYMKGSRLRRRYTYMVK